MTPSAKTSYVDPSSLSSFPSPAASPGSPSDSEPGPSRKRARTELSSEERKEARAHRNRIAAQNSRDRRKAQFNLLEQRVAELEEENRQLRAGMGLIPTPVQTSIRAEELQKQEQERRQAQSKENEELRERIKTLERGWDAVVKALAAQGLPNLFSQFSSTSPAPSSPSPAPVKESSTPSPSPSTQSAPSVTAPSTSKFTPSTLTSTIFPLSPAPSHSSLDFDLDLSTSGSPVFAAATDFAPTPESGSEHEQESTRHLARVASTEVSTSVALQRVVSRSPPSPSALLGPVDDAIMEDLFREILAPSPILSASSLPTDASLEAAIASTPAAPAPEMRLSLDENLGLNLGADGLPIVDQSLFDGADEMSANWENEADVQKILDLLPSTFTSDTLSHLGLDFADLGNLSSTSLSGIGVF
ncbi:hypothetical protein BDN72DRAFT_859824 [Pluteus cervinus]|uniref:Uncharacterized protein n=1 Tax=Pluteus cervinus TaxID=181527 RepID=A0ACD3ALC0_9AGAR|nr:hypothetical protein BDN72DRAFT_859824 [Pluteus cervinus]